MTAKKEQHEEMITAYKGFNSDMSCLGFQYEIGKTYEHEGEVNACSSGFHACEYPLDVFMYYQPASSVYAVVEQSGTICRHDDDSKVASSSINIQASITLTDVINAAIEYTQSRTKKPKKTSNSGNLCAASNSGSYGAAMSCGHLGKVSGCIGSALFLTERDKDLKIISVWSGIVGTNGVEPDVFYTLKNGKLERVA